MNTTTLNLTPEQARALLAALDKANEAPSQEDKAFFVKAWAEIENTMQEQFDNWYN